MKQKFLGELKHISPARLIKENEKDKLADFFLVLGSIFNDLKGFILFEKLVQENYEKPEPKDITAHAGEYGGILIQVHKLIASTIHEFFRFLNENKDIVDSKEFKELLSRLSTQYRERWNEIIAVAFNKIPESNNFTETLVKIRNNVGFHYYQSGKNLRKGFIRKFFSKEKSSDNKNEEAYYATGENMGSTRFYYCDAAVEEFLFITTGNDNSLNKNNYMGQVRAIIDDMNFAIASILKEYIRVQRNNPQR